MYTKVDLNSEGNVYECQDLASILYEGLPSQGKISGKLIFLWVWETFRIVVIGQKMLKSQGNAIEFVNYRPWQSSENIKILSKKTIHARSIYLLLVRVTLKGRL